MAVGAKKAAGKRSSTALVPALKSKAPASGLTLGRVSSVVEMDLFNGFFSRTYPALSGNGTSVYLNPDPIVMFESGLNGTQIYDELLDKDAHLAGCWDARVNSILGLPRIMEPGGEDDRAKEIASGVARLFEAIPDLDEVLACMAMAILRGYDVQEVEYKIDANGQVCVKRIHNLPPDVIVFDVDWNPRLRNSTNPLTGVPLPDRKFIVTRYRPRYGNPYGCGVGRTLYWPSWFKKNGLKFWLVYCEKFGMPTVIGKHPKNAPQSDKTKFLNVLRSVQRETAIVMDTEMEAELLEAQRNGQATVYEQLCNFLNSEMSKRLLGQTLTTESNPGSGSGSFALGKVHGDVRADILQADAAMLSRVLNDGLIRWLTDFNYGEQDDELYPRLRLDAEPPEDMNVVADEYTKLLAMDVPLALKDVMARFKLRTPEPDEETLNDLKKEAAAEALAAMGGIPGGPGDAPPGDMMPGGKKKPKPKDEESDAND